MSFKNVDFNNLSQEDQCIVLGAVCRLLKVKDSVFHMRGVLDSLPKDLGEIALDCYPELVYQSYEKWKEQTS